MREFIYEFEYGSCCESNSGLQVLENIFLRAELMRRGDGAQDSINPFWFVGPGITRGAGAAGGGRGPEIHGLTGNRVIPNKAGSSTGIAMLLFERSRQIRTRDNIYWNEVTTRDFFSPLRFFSGQPVEDAAYICDVFRSKLDHEALRNNPAGFYVGVTDAETGEGVFLDGKALPDMVKAVEASISIPGLSRGPVEINGRHYLDGAGAMAMPIRKIVEQFHPTDLLIFANKPRLEKRNPYHAVIANVLWRKLPEPVRRAFSTVEEQVAHELEYLRSLNDMRWMIMWSEQSSPFDFNPRNIEARADRAERFLAPLLQSAKANVMGKYGFNPAN